MTGGRRTFRGAGRGLAVRAACAFLVFLGIVACLAPFLATSAPLLAVAGDRRVSPAIEALTAVDLAWLGGGAAAVLGVLARRLAGRLRIAVAAAAVLAALLTAVVAPSREARNVRARYDLDALRAAPSGTLSAPIPFSPDATDPARRYAAPGRGDGHLLGTDRDGRDVTARLIHGTRSSLTVGFLAVLASSVIGILLGAIAGLRGGRADAIISWLIQVTMAFPALFTVLVLFALVKPGLLTLVLLLVLIRWTVPARLVRAEMQRLREADHIVAARALGAGPLRVLVVHALPAALPPVIVNAAFGVAGAVLAEAALSFLGIGVVEPAPSWGEILRQGRDAVPDHLHLVVLPGSLLFLLVLSLHALGEALRVSLDAGSGRAAGMSAGTAGRPTAPELSAGGSAGSRPGGERAPCC